MQANVDVGIIMGNEREGHNRLSLDVQLFAQLTSEAGKNVLFGVAFAAGELPISAESILLTASADQHLPVAIDHGQSNIDAFDHGGDAKARSEFIACAAG